MAPHEPHHPGLSSGRLPWARLEWRTGRPWAPDYGDSYFGSDDPKAEVQEVFIEANDLPARFAAGGSIAVGETGFGTGLNILQALAEWRRHAPPDAFLALFSLEAHPLSPADLAEVHRHLGLDNADSAALRAQYPPPAQGLHRIHFPGGRAVLTLGFGDAAPLLAEVRGGIDAWFLDGFAPRSNPALWNTGVFRQIARLSHAGTTFGTYTAAGQVRRDLEATGFRVERVPGHGGKRERLTGRFAGSADRRAPQRVAVVGAGIAGLSAALALQDRGCTVSVYDPAGAGGGTSSNPAAVLLPNLHPTDHDLNDLSLAGVRATRALLERLEAAGARELRLAEGVAFHGITAHGRKRVERLLAAGEEAFGELFDRNGPACGPEPHIHYAAGCAVDLAACCHALASALPPVRRHKVIGIDSPGDGHAARLLTRNGQTEFDAIILANGVGDSGPLCEEQRAISTVTGQSTRVHASLPDWGGFVATGRGYCIPQPDSTAWLGATYRRTGPAGEPETDRMPRPEDDRTNLEHLGWVPGLGDTGAVRILDHWVGTRTVVRDRLPMVGPAWQDSEGRILLTLAHGSRGLLYAPLAGQLLADRLLGLIEPLPAAVTSRLHPSRVVGDANA